MAQQTVLIIGATGDVGIGVVGASMHRGWTVTAAARSGAKLEKLRERWPTARTVVADVATIEGVGALVASGREAPWSAVVVTVNVSSEPAAMLSRASAEVMDYLTASLVPHLNCLNAFLPVLGPGAVFLGVGGGMADFVVPGMGAVSMAQAAQRMAYRSAAKEARGGGVTIRELLIRSMVAGESNRAGAEPGWLTDRQVGERVCDLLAEPGDLRDPVVVLDP